MKARCKRCLCLDYDFIRGEYEERENDVHVCGLHGCAPVDIDGEQKNLDGRGGCGFIPKPGPVQLSLF